MPGRKASFVAGSPRMASSAAMRTSQAMTICSPPPMQCPWTPAITGLSRGSSARKARAALEDRPLEDDVRDAPELADASRRIASDQHEVGALAHRDLAEVGALTGEEARVLPGRRAQRLAGREARLDELRELEMEPRTEIGRASCRE